MTDAGRMDLLEHNPDAFAAVFPENILWVNLSPVNIFNAAFIW